MINLSRYISRRYASSVVNLYLRLKQHNEAGEFRDTLALFNQHVRNQSPTDLAVVQALKACIELGDVQCASIIHRRLSPESMNNSFIQTNLIRFFLKNDDIHRAQEIFASAKGKTTMMYNTMINGLAEHGQGQQGIDLFHRMTTPPNEYTSTIIFKICAQLTDEASLHFGQKMLKSLPDEYRRKTVVLNAALHMLIQRGQISEGEQLFDQMDKDNVTYGIMMSGYLKHDQQRKTIDLFFTIEKPNEANYRVFFQACGRLGNNDALALAKQVISRLSTQGSLKNIESKVSITILDMFIKCRDTESAEKLFDRMKRDVVSYGLLMKMYNENNQPEKCLPLFERMKSGKIQPNEIIDVLIINAYLQLNQFDQATRILENSKRKTTVMYNTMINGLAEHGQGQQGIDLFHRMTTPPNEYTSTIIFKICAQLADEASLHFGQRMLKSLSDEYRRKTVVLNAALHMLIQRGQISEGEQLFDQMDKDNVTYGIMMSGYLKHDQPRKAIDLFFTIEKPDEANYRVFFQACGRLGNNDALALAKQVISRLSTQGSLKNIESKVSITILDMFIKCRDTESAEKLFDRMKRDVVSYGLLMKMYNEDNQPEKCLSLFERMKSEELEPNEMIHLSIIKACSLVGHISICNYVVSQLPPSVRMHLKIQTGLMDMWGKGGEVRKAQDIFNTMERHDAAMFSVIINSYGLNGKGVQAVEQFRRVPSDMITETTYTCVLNACSHSGLVDEAREIFFKIPSEMKSARVQTTMIDALCRAQLIEEAQQLLDEYERNHTSYLPMYMAILSAARTQRHAILAQQIFDRMSLLFKEDSNGLTAATVLLANTYALGGECSKASDLQTKLTQSGAKKTSGLSWTAVNGRITKFRAHDRSYPFSDAIYRKLEHVTREITEYGYTSDSSWITRPLMNDETPESILCGHSERLAIGYNLIQEPLPSYIQVTKNLRICRSCHLFTKLVARHTGLHIIMRDKNRIHHFYPNGECSCRDYF